MRYSKIPFRTSKMVSGELTSKNAQLLIKAGFIHQEIAGVEVLFDDRSVGVGEKFADCDLLEIPVRLVVSPKSGDKIEQYV